MKPIIKVENISKQYRLGNIGLNTIRDDFQRWLYRIQGKEDPLLKIGEVNNRKLKGSSEYVWALKDITFEVMPGDILGIIGENGAGKSTLLKILSKVTGPTTGRIDFNGRISSLLEVGTGFHPDLTGRENIFLNGAILGLNKREIRSRLDEIIDFSGCERYIDTPVKRYSSGMIVRLGFAVAAHLEPEILIVDEVLAVGDAEFQKKAVGKMQDVNVKEGRTVLVVSHNMTIMNELCNRGILLENGIIKCDTTINNAIFNHITSNNAVTEKKWLNGNAPGNDKIKLRKAYIINKENKPINHAYINEEIGFCAEYELLSELSFFTHGINVFNSMDIHLFSSHDNVEIEKDKKFKPGYYKTTVWIPANLLQSDYIKISFACMKYNPFEQLFHEINVLRLNVLEPEVSLTRNESYKGKLPGLIRPCLKWEERQLI
ncbi:ABC transporter ATP-binding protein [Spirosoma sp. BT702]|uniref:ABC transporter ATP-binding protein n=1 Tax=Spirosoma profusum TaxID=2771354 RepID=A0A926Y2C0_9BACT|nr:ABC transporter ATP-binding protein [Spirosoma profusum]MBD2700671.1 ABC transporter ATP-binding protein [Spirosoma profusum]